MSEEFVALLSELFPSISEGTIDQLKAFIRQYERNPSLYYGSKREDKLYQGDIISKVPFLYITENGRRAGYILNGLIVSHSCDVEHNATILIAPVYDMKLFEHKFSNNPETIDNLEKNLIFDKFYLPPFSDYHGFIADLSGITTFETGYVNRGLRDKKMKILASLSQTGYYFFICKLTVHFLRREPSDAIREDNINTS